MAAKYCLNCGYKNDYVGSPPALCVSCKTDLQAVAKDIIRLVHVASKDKATYEKRDFPVFPEGEVEQVEGSEFDSLMEGEPESITQDEIEKIFLANANRGFNLKDFLEEELDKVARASKQAKPKPKTKSARKKAK